MATTAAVLDLIRRLDSTPPVLLNASAVGYYGHHGDEILNELRGIDAQLFSRSVDILVSRLRQKLGDTGKDQRYIKTVWGTGYVFLGQEIE